MALPLPTDFDFDPLLDSIGDTQYILVGQAGVAAPPSTTPGARELGDG